MLQHYRGIHNGEDIFILCSGKSLDFWEHRVFRERITIGINHISQHIPNTTYTVSKDGYIARPPCKTFLSRGKWGMSHVNNTIPKRLAAHVVSFPHFRNTMTSIHHPENGLIVSGSTVTSAMHLAALMGARVAFLVGHDAIRIDGETNLRGYHTNRTRAGWGRTFTEQDQNYRRWLTSTHKTNLRARSYLTSRYHTVFVSAHPFLDFHLDGHRSDSS